MKGYRVGVPCSGASSVVLPTLEQSGHELFVCRGSKHESNMGMNALGCPTHIIVFVSCGRDNRLVHYSYNEWNKLNLIQLYLMVLTPRPFGSQFRRPVRD